MKNELQAIKPETARWSVADLQAMADQVARSKLFGLDAAQAFTLMCLCDAEGMHPIKAVQRYHVIQGRPAMKADAMLADFLRIGGTVKWITESDDREKCEAIFTHPKFAPEGKTIRFSIADAKSAGLTGNPNWQKYTPDMLSARVISRGVRRIAPGIVAGLYTPEEVADTETPEVSATVVTAKIMEPLKKEVLEHHAINHNNESGHGSGAYAKPDLVLEYQKWILSCCEDVNTRWLDYLTDKFTGEITGKAPAEVVSTWQLSGHLLKFAKAKGWVNAPEEIRAGQRDKFAALAWDRHSAAFDEEVKDYCRNLWRDARAKHKRETTDIPAREPGSDDDLEHDVSDASINVSDAN